MEDAAQAIMAIGLFGTIAITVRSIATVWVKRIEARSTSPVPNALEQRLARIEEAVGSIAVEVERISESQRFMARVATEREQRPLLRGTASEGRSITPH